MGRKYLLRTLGCKVNQYESQQLREILEAQGLRPVDAGQAPDLAVVNTCAVTGTASAKTRQAVRQATAGGTVPVVVVGCGATADADRLRYIPGVVGLWTHLDGVADSLRRFLVHWLGSGPGQAAEPPVAAGSNGEARRRIAGNDLWMKPTPPVRTEPLAGAMVPGRITHTSVALSPRDVNGRPRAGTTIRRFPGHQRAFLKVQDGCDAHCTYCIIPRVRPLLSFKPVDVAVREAEDLVRAGHREIVITGIYLGAYGRSTAVRRRFDSPDESPLAELVDALARIDGLVRLRLSSLEPGDVDDRLLAVLARHDCCVPHLHLPLQSGSSTILRRMNRQYDADDYRAMIARVRAALDRPAISTDVVVGFPGETDDDFEQTLAAAREAGFCKIHAFPFSPRPGTAAACWKNDFVAPAVVRQRLAHLRELENHLAKSFQEQFLGSAQRVLLETRNGSTPNPKSPIPNPQSNSRLLCGRSDRYFEVHFPPPAGQHLEPGDLACVRIDDVSPEQVLGTGVEPPAGNHSLLRCVGTGRSKAGAGL